MRFDRRVSTQHVDILAHVFGDKNPMHEDAQAAQAAGLERPIAHGAILMCFLSEIIGQQLGFVAAMCCGVDVSYERPFFVNDLLSIDVEARHHSAALCATTFAFTVLRGLERVARGEFLVKELAPASRRGSVKVAAEP